MSQRRVVRVVPFLGMLIGALGCVAPPKVSPAAARVEWIDPATNLAAFRLRVDEFYDRYHDGLALAVDEAVDLAETQEQRVAVTLWGTRATAQARECLFRADPLAALFDAWMLPASSTISSLAPTWRRGSGPERASCDRISRSWRTRSAGSSNPWRGTGRSTGSDLWWSRPPPSIRCWET
ncbi:MAG: hypothetical protein AAF957_19925 [Planctomycetota bacterium]